MRGWGFDLRDIRVPVKIWHGRQDRFVPAQHGQWLAAGIPGAEADISDRDGHLTMIGRVGEIHDWLLRYFQQDLIDWDQPSGRAPRYNSSLASPASTWHETGPESVIPP